METCFLCITCTVKLLLLQKLQMLQFFATTRIKHSIFLDAQNTLIPIWGVVGKHSKVIFRGRWIPESLKLLKTDMHAVIDAICFPPALLEINFLVLQNFV